MEAADRRAFTDARGRFAEAAKKSARAIFSVAPTPRVAILAILACFGAQEEEETDALNFGARALQPTPEFFRLDGATVIDTLRTAFVSDYSASAAAAPSLTPLVSLLEEAINSVASTITTISWPSFAPDYELTEKKLEAALAARQDNVIKQWAKLCSSLRTTLRTLLANPTPSTQSHLRLKFEALARTLAINNGQQLATTTVRLLHATHGGGSAADPATAATLHACLPAALAFAAHHLVGTDGHHPLRHELKVVDSTLAPDLIRAALGELTAYHRELQPKTLRTTAPTYRDATTPVALSASLQQLAQDLGEQGDLSLTTIETALVSPASTSAVLLATPTPTPTSASPPAANSGDNGGRRAAQSRRGHGQGTPLDLRADGCAYHGSLTHRTTECHVLYKNLMTKSAWGDLLNDSAALEACRGQLAHSSRVQRSGSVKTTSNANIIRDSDSFYSDSHASTLASELGAALHAVLSLLHICLLFIQQTPPAACSFARDASDRLQPLVATAQSLLQRLSPTPPTSTAAVRAEPPTAGISAVLNTLHEDYGHVQRHHTPLTLPIDILPHKYGAPGGHHTMVVDTGAGVSLIDAKLAQQLQLTYQPAERHAQLAAANGSHIVIDGAVDIAIVFGGARIDLHDVLVVKQLAVPLLLGTKHLFHNPAFTVEIRSGGAPHATPLVRLGDSRLVRALERRSHRRHRARPATSRPRGARPLATSSPVDERTRSLALSATPLDDALDRFYGASLDSIAVTTVATSDTVVDDPTLDVRTPLTTASSIAHSADATRLHENAQPALALLPFELSQTYQPIATNLPDWQPMGGPDRLAYQTVIDKLPADIDADLRDQYVRIITDTKDHFGGLKLDGCQPFPPVADLPPLVVVPHQNADLEHAATNSHISQSAAQTTTMQQHYRDLLDAGLIEPTTGPVSSPTFVVHQSDKDRVVIDYHRVNDITYSNHNILPKPDDIHQLAAKRKFFSKFDLVASFYQIPLDDRSRPLTACRFGGQLYQFKVAPTGMKQSPTHLQSCMDQLVVEHSERYDILAYVDDIIVIADTQQDLLTATARLFEKVRRLRLTLSARKTTIAVESIEILGAQIQNNKIEPPETRITALAEFGRPRTVRELRAFLGLYNQLGAHAAHVRSQLRPLFSAASNKFKSGAKLEWSSEMTTAFEVAKAALADLRPLSTFDDTKPLVVLTDASDTGAGAALCQLNDAHDDFVLLDALAHAFDDTQLNYSTAHQEALALRLAARRWRHLMLGRTTIWLCDNQPAVNAMKSAHISTSVRMRNTVAELTGFHIIAAYVPGGSHLAADCLSRDPRFSPDALDQYATLAEHEPLRLDDLGDLSAPKQLCALVSNIMTVDTPQPQPLPAALLANIGVRQLADKALRPLFDAARRTTAPPIPIQPTIVDDTLYVQPYKQRLLVIPVDRRKAALQHAHGAEHKNLQQTVDSARTQFYWPTLHDDAVKFIRSCPHCLSVDVSANASKSSNNAHLPARPLSQFELHAEIAGEQQLDPALAPYFAAIAQPDNASSTIATLQPQLINNKLYVQVHNRKLLVVPQQLRAKAIATAHGAQHVGAQRAVEVATRHFYWPGMTGDIISHVRACAQCERVNAQRRQSPGNLGNLEAKRAPTRYRSWDLDTFHFGPELGGYWAITAVEHYSRLAVAHVVVDRSAHAAVEAIHTMIIAPFGQPREVFFDEGKEFHGALKQELQRRGVQTHRSIVENHNGAARVERLHRDLNNQFAHMFLANNREPPQSILQARHWLWRALDSHNATPNPNTHLSPQEMLTGYQRLLPMAALLEQPEIDQVRHADPELAHHLQLDFNLLHETLAAHDVERQRHYTKQRSTNEKTFAAKNGPTTQYLPGDVVTARMPVSLNDGDGKLGKRLAYAGRWRVVEHDPTTNRVKIQLLFPLTELDDHAMATGYTQTVHVRDTQRVNTPEIIVEGQPLPLAADSPLLNSDVLSVDPLLQPTTPVTWRQAASRAITSGLQSNPRVMSALRQAADEREERDAAAAQVARSAARAEARAAAISQAVQASKQRDAAHLQRAEQHYKHRAKRSFRQVWSVSTTAKTVTGTFSKPGQAQQPVTKSYNELTPADKIKRDKWLTLRQIGRSIRQTRAQLVAETRQQSNDTSTPSSSSSSSAAAGAGV